MKWTQEQQNAAMQFVADAAREFSPEGCLDRHAVSHVTFELACQRNELLELERSISQAVPLFGGWDARPTWFTDDDAWQAWVDISTKAGELHAKAEGK